MSQNNGDLSGFSMSELFRLEVESQAADLTAGLLALENDPAATHLLEGLMRAAHSLKGAARIIERNAAVRLMHAMEDCFVAAQNGEISLPPARIDLLLQGVDLLNRMAQIEENEAAAWDLAHQAEFEAFLADLAKPAAEIAPAAPDTPALPLHIPDTAPDTPALPLHISTPPLHSLTTPLHIATPPLHSLTLPLHSLTTPLHISALPLHISALPLHIAAPALDTPPVANNGKTPEAANRALRVSSDNLNCLMGLAGELVVTSRWAETFSAELLRLKRTQQELTKSVNGLRESLGEANLNEAARSRLAEVGERQAHCGELLSARLADVEAFDRRFVGLSSRLYQEVLECRMRPFADGIGGFARMVRDVARSLGKEARLEIGGEATLVDRDILERIEAPLGHLLRNAVDHGIENSQKRRATGKPESAVVRLEAAHSAGMLLITVSDDGGIEAEKVRAAIVEKRLTSAEVAATMSDAELMEFLFLPGFSMKNGVTEISGRGVGLDAVQTMVREVGGTVRVTAQPANGTQFQLQLPLTLSVIRTLLVEIGGEPYAFPLARITGALKVAREEIETVQGRQHFNFGGQQIGLVTAHQILEIEAAATLPDTLSVIVLGNKAARYGVAIDRFLREQELVVRPLDPRLGKVKDISAAALMPDRSPVLIIDVEDLIRSIENLVSGGRVANARRGGENGAQKPRKRVLVVDDSLTVRELERKLLDGKGYQVEVAVDGMDGWNAARAGHYDLIITDVDMPRLDGIELVKLVKGDARLSSLPIMIVSYKDREEDRRRGLEAGADYYLTKGSFHDESLLGAVADLIGEAVE